MNTPSEKPVRAAGVLLMTRRPPREFLLMKHLDRWDLPKGHCDPGESDRETALREMEEETGIGATEVELDPNFCFEIEYPVQDAHHERPFRKRVRYFLGVVRSKPEIELSEHVGYRWWTWEPPHHIQAQTIDPLLAAVEKYLAGGDSKSHGITA